MNKVSIIMGIYNCEKTLKESIDSIIKQTYKDWELIMCDDGSDDNTYKVASNYADKYENIMLLKNYKNMGLNYTLNYCAKYAKGKYIARQDGDDISLPQRLEKEVNFLENHNDYDIVSCPMIYFDETGEWGKGKAKEIPKSIDFVKGTPFAHGPCVIKREAFDKVTGYSEDKKLLRVEDYHLWFKLYKEGYKGYNLQEHLYKMRDDREAFNRRTYKNRINEAYVKYVGFKMLGISIVYYIYILRPLIIGLLPESIYRELHQRKIGKTIIRGKDKNGD